MKKTLIAIALLCVGTAAFAAAPSAAKAPKALKQFGPGTVATADEVLVSKLDILSLNATTGAVTAQKLKAFKTGKVAYKKTVDNILIPAGYKENGGEKWAWNDVNAAKILAIKGTTAFIELDFLTYTRIYVFKLNKLAAKIKVLGSTSNIVSANFIKASSDGRKVWIQAAEKGETDVTVQEFTNKKLNGLYKWNKKTKDYSKTKLYRAAKTYTVDAASVSVVLPAEKKFYNYEETVNAGSPTTLTDITIYK